MMSLTVTVVELTVVKNKVNRPNACFTTLCQSTDFDDQSNLSPIVQKGALFSDFNLIMNDQFILPILQYCNYRKPAI
jgi:hypothetical protein